MDLEKNSNKHKNQATKTDNQPWQQPEDEEHQVEEIKNVISSLP